MSKAVTLEQVFNRTETIECSNTFNYIEQDAINGKNSIISGNETLKKYPLLVKLHHSWCNPQSVIDEIEEKAKNREIINYFQKGKYIGDYVIDSYKINISQMLDNVIVYAEIEINLLENPDITTEFEQQSKIIPNISLSVFSENSNKMKNFMKDAKTKIKNAVFNETISTLQSGRVSELSKIGKRLFNSFENEIINEIKKKGLINVNSIVEKWTNRHIDFVTDAENEIIKNELLKIPNILTNYAIRNKL